MNRANLLIAGQVLAITWTVYVFGTLGERFGLFEAGRAALQLAGPTVPR